MSDCMLWLSWCMLASTERFVAARSADAADALIDSAATLPVAP
jgi:hypothetical protein